MSLPTADAVRRMSTERALLNVIDDANSVLRRTLPLNKSLREQARFTHATAQRRLAELRARTGGSQRPRPSRPSPNTSSAAPAGGDAAQRPLDERVADAKAALGIAPSAEKQAARQRAAEVRRSFGGR